jgi:pimeloyl-ACP methyl ester carboxylesterase
MLMFRSKQAEEILSANNFAQLVETVLSDGLKQGYFTEEDRQAYIEAWSQPGALTGGLNYYRAAGVGPPAGEDRQKKGKSASDQSSLIIRVPTLVIWGEKDTALLTGNLEGLDRFVSDLTIRRIPDGSHWVIHEKPDLVNVYIREFIEGRK